MKHKELQGHQVQVPSHLAKLEGSLRHPCQSHRAQPYQPDWNRPLSGKCDLWEGNKGFSFIFLGKLLVDWERWWLNRETLAFLLLGSDIYQRALGNAPDEGPGARSTDRLQRLTVLRQLVSPFLGSRSLPPCCPPALGTKSKHQLWTL